MTRTLSPHAQRAERRSAAGANKTVDRRDQLAEAALATLAELGYARTSLREIAQNAEFSHGVLHYYFTDKTDLLMHCVRLYKSRCVLRYDGVAAAADSPAEVVDGFIASLTVTLTEDATLQRLWYDLRVQSMFSDEFRGEIAEIDQMIANMVWRILNRYCQLSGAQPAMSRGLTYALVDGVFSHAVQAHLAGQTGVVDELTERIRYLVPAVLTRPSN